MGSPRGDLGGMGSALPRRQVPAVVASTTATPTTTRSVPNSRTIASDLVVSLSIGGPVRPDDSRMIQSPAGRRGLADYAVPGLLAFVAASSCSPNLRVYRPPCGKPTVTTMGSSPNSIRARPLRK